MRAAPRSFRGLLGNFMVISLLTCILTSAFQIDFSARSLPSRFFKRSIPGSLATAPQGAVGFPQPPPGPPPGPINDDPLPPETWGVVKPTTTTTGQEMHHELRQLPTSFDESPTVHDSKQYAIVTKTETVVASTSTGIASRDTISTTTSVFFCIFICLLRL